MRRVKNKVSLSEARKRLQKFKYKHGRKLFYASELADVIWPEKPFINSQGAGAAASRVLKRVNAYWIIRRHSYGYERGWSLEHV